MGHFIISTRAKKIKHAQDFMIANLAAEFNFQQVTRRNYEQYLSSDPKQLIVSHNPHADFDNRIIERYRRAGRVVSHLHCQHSYLPEKEQKNLARSLRHSSDVVVPATFLREQYQKKGFDVSKWNVVSNGVSMSRFYPSSEEERANFRNRNGLESNSKLVAFVGRLKPMKGSLILKLIAGMLAERELKLLIQFPAWHGQYADGENTEFERVAASILQIAPYDVRLLPDTNPHTEPRYVRYCDLLVCPSLSEVQPLTVLEAMASGLPIVALGCSQNFYDWHNTGTFTKDDISVVDLPVRMQRGDFNSLQLDQQEMINMATRLLDEIQKINPPDDEQRQHRSHKLQKAGFTLRKMFDGYRSIYI